MIKIDINEILCGGNIVEDYLQELKELDRMIKKLQGTKYLIEKDLIEVISSAIYEVGGFYIPQVPPKQRDKIVEQVQEYMGEYWDIGYFDSDDKICICANEF